MTAGSGEAIVSRR